MCGKHAKYLLKQERYPQKYQQFVDNFKKCNSISVNNCDKIDKKNARKVREKQRKFIDTLGRV